MTLHPSMGAMAQSRAGLTCTGSDAVDDFPRFLYSFQVTPMVGSGYAPGSSHHDGSTTLDDSGTSAGFLILAGR
jgi:hypothetical protein